MLLLERLRNNSTSFHIRTKEEIDILFAEMEEIGQLVDSQLDFLLRMSIQKVKLQLYYVSKLEEYRRKTISVKTKVSDREVNNVSISEPTKKKKAKKKVKKKKKETRRQRERREELEFEESLKGLTTVEKIAANKARVAKYHPEPDFSTFNPSYRRALSKMEFQKEMKEKAKKLWYSIVSVPMGGMNK